MDVLNLWSVAFRCFCDLAADQARFRPSPAGRNEPASTKCSNEAEVISARDLSTDASAFTDGATFARNRGALNHESGGGTLGSVHCLFLNIRKAKHYSLLRS